MPVAPAAEFWLIAGSNGAGKTTLVSRSDIRQLLGSVELLNPDRLAQEIVLLESLTLDDANLRAAQRIEQRVAALIEDDESFLVETVLSSDKYLKHVRRAKERGHFIGMIYVALPTPEMAVARVAARVAFEHGHDVPEDKIRSRWHRSHRFLGEFMPLVDRLLVFSNADPTGNPVLIARKGARGLELLIEGVQPEVDKVFASLARAAD